MFQHLVTIYYHPGVLVHKLIDFGVNFGTIWIKVVPKIHSKKVRWVFLHITVAAEVSFHYQ